MSAPRSLTANYGVQYQLTLATAPAAVGTAHITGAATGDWFDSGSTVNVLADLNVAKATGERYHFSAWSGASTSTSLSTSVTMDAPKSLTANCNRVQYELSLATDPAAVGTVHISGAANGDWFDSGSTVNLTADQNVAKDTGERYHFSAWSCSSDGHDADHVGDDERTALADGELRRAVLAHAQHEPGERRHEQPVGQPDW